MFVISKTSKKNKKSKKEEKMKNRKKKKKPTPDVLKRFLQILNDF